MYKYTIHPSFLRAATTTSELFRIIIFVSQRHPGGLKLKLSFPRRWFFHVAASQDSPSFPALFSLDSLSPSLVRSLLFPVRFMLSFFCLNLQTLEENCLGESVLIKYFCLQTFHDFILMLSYCGTR